MSLQVIQNKEKKKKKKKQAYQNTYFFSTMANSRLHKLTTAQRSSLLNT